MIGKQVTVTGLHCSRKGQRARVVWQVSPWTVILRFSDGTEELYGISAIDHGLVLS